MNLIFGWTSISYRIGLIILALLTLTGCSAGYNLQPFGSNVELTKQVQSHEQALQVIAQAINKIQNQLAPKKVDK